MLSFSPSSRFPSILRRLSVLLIIAMLVCAATLKFISKPTELEIQYRVAEARSLKPRSPSPQDLPASAQLINSVSEKLASLKHAIDCTNLPAPDTATYCLQLEQHRNNFINRTKNQRPHSKNPQHNNPIMTINVAAIACEERGREEVVVMLKSALLVGQESHIHAHVFSDNRTLPALGVDLMELKWTAEVLGWSFTFTLHMEWFPAEVPLRNMWAPCAAQRLFFPSLLPHVDSVLYIDADMIVLSNLTEIWNIFEKMSEKELAAVAPNSEGPPDDHHRRYPIRGIPFVGKRGLNAGFMLMNLSRMRQVDMESVIQSSFRLFKKRIQLADQDLYNIIFYGYPEWLHPIDCSYNFYWRHCLAPAHDPCVQGDHSDEVNCFCSSVLAHGVRIIHGNTKSFHKEGFWADIYQGFKTVDLLIRNDTKWIQQLQQKFDARHGPCSDLTSALLYANVLRYLGVQQ